MCGFVSKCVSISLSYTCYEHIHVGYTIPIINSKHEFEKLVLENQSLIPQLHIPFERHLEERVGLKILAQCVV